MPLPIRPATVVAGVIAALALAVPAIAHQTVSSNGATVTVHVAPDDAPVAGSPSSINIVSVKVPKGATFRLSRARVKVTDAGGATLLNRHAARHVTFTFPKAGAYEITVSGSYRRHGRTRRFATPFAIRAGTS